MKQQVFSLLHAMESSWWYNGRTAIIDAALAKTEANKELLSVLDFGAGYGGMYRALSRYSSKVSAFEPEPEAQQKLKARGYANISSTPEEALQTRYDGIALFDVLEHIEDDSAFLRKAHNALNEGGKLFITVPAHPFLWSQLDIDAHHFRRYKKKQLIAVLTDTGYEIELLSHWNMFLFLIVAPMRLVGLTGTKSIGMHPLIDSLFLFLIKWEASLLGVFTLPFGVSFVVVARKRA